MWRLPKLPLVFWLFRALVCIMTFLVAGVVFDVAQVLGLVFICLCYPSCVDPSGWMTSPTSMKLNFLGSLGLRLINGRQWMGPSLFFILRNLIAVLLIGVVFVFFDQRPISFRAPGVNFFNHRVWLEAGLCFCIDSFFYHFFPCI